MGNFDEDFRALTGKSPFPWQRALFHRLHAGEIPVACDIPTGLGKTSVIAVWLLARSEVATLPTRLVYVVNRRTVVDQTTVEVERIRARLASAEHKRLDERLAGAGLKDLAISTLRGQMADNRAWSEDPSKPAVICGTVDMIGSRLLFSGYRIGFKGKPLHAGFLGQDALLVHDEAHLEPSFQTLLDNIVEEQKRCRDPWPLRVMALTATQRKPQDALGPAGARMARAVTTSATPREQQELRLRDEDYADPEIKKRIEATKRLSLHPHDANGLVEKVVAQVLTYKESKRAVLVFLRTVDDVGKAAVRLGRAGLRTERLTGTMRGYERDGLVKRSRVFNRFLPKDDRKTDPAEGTVVLVCTSAGEVGVNLSADHLVCDLSTFDAMAQRFGRVNRFGDRPDSEVHVFHPPAEGLEADGTPRTQALLATLAPPPARWQCLPEGARNVRSGGAQRCVCTGSTNRSCDRHRVRQVGVDEHSRRVAGPTSGERLLARRARVGTSDHAGGLAKRGRPDLGAATRAGSAGGAARRLSALAS